MANRVEQDEWVFRVLGIRSPGQTANQNAAGQTVPPVSGPSTAGAVAYGKARLTWLDARSRLISDLDALRAAVRAYYQDEGVAASIDRQFSARVQPKLAVLDETLADTLDMALNATDPARRGELVETARAMIGRYQSFIASDRLFRTIDDNPFLPLSTARSMTQTLANLASTIR